jgi:hypothetical protein
MGTDKIIRVETVASSKDISLAPETAGHAGQDQKGAANRLYKPLP